MADITPSIATTTKSSIKENPELLVVIKYLFKKIFNFYSMTDVVLSGASPDAIHVEIVT